MVLLDPNERIQRGVEQQEKLLATSKGEPETLLQSSWRDYIFSEVWTRPGLDLKARYLISISGAASNSATNEQIDDYVRGALSQNILSVVELREAALHLAVYAGWSKGTLVDEAVSRIVAELGLKEAAFAPICDKPWDPDERLAKGEEEFDNVMTFGGPPPICAYFEGGIKNFVFGEMWHREGLDQRSRRWVTLVGVSDSSAEIPIRTHVYGAMASGNANYGEMNEFVLQYAIHSGWPRASYVQGAVMEMAKKVADGLFWDGTKLEKNDASGE